MTKAGGFRKASFIRSLADRFRTTVERQEWRKIRSELMAAGMSRDDAAAEVSKQKKDQKEKQAKAQVPNRVELRSKGLNMTRATGMGFARVSSAKKTPASLYTLVAIHQPLADGTVRKMVIPRENFERK